MEKDGSKDSRGMVGRWLLSLEERPALVEIVAHDGSQQTLAVHDVRYWAASVERRVEAAAGGMAAPPRTLVARRADGVVVDALALPRIAWIEGAEESGPALESTTGVDPGETARAYAQAHADTRALLAACSSAGQALLDQAIRALQQASELRAEAARERQQVARRLEVVQRASVAAAQAAPVTDDDLDERVSAAVERAIPALIAQHAPQLMSILGGEK